MPAKPRIRQLGEELINVLRRLNTLLACAVLLSAVAVAQRRPISVDVAANPEMDRLARAFTGKWRTHEVFSPNEFYPKGAERTGVAEFYLATGGTSLIENVHSDGSAGKLDFMAVLWWDESEKTYKMFTCGNGGSPPCHMRGEARWEDNNLVNDYVLTIKGAAHKADDVFEEISPRSFTLVFSADLFAKGMEHAITTTYTRE